MADEQDLTPDEGNEPQLTEVEIRASQEGWVPEDQWQGDPDKWRPAKEFLDRGELFRKIEEQKRELKSVKLAMEELGRHHAKVREMEYERALKTLKAQKRDAIAEGDADAVVEIEDKIDELKEKQHKVEPTPRVQEPHPAVVAWQERNPWYHSNKVMKAAADEVAREMVAMGELDPVKVLAEVDKIIRQEFRDKFVNPNRDKAGPVEGTPKGRAPKEDAISMSDEDRKVMNRIVSTGVMTKEQFLKEFKDLQKRG